MNASRHQLTRPPSDNGEHVELDNHEFEWLDFPTCEETKKPLQLHYGVEGEVNCTIPMIDDAFYHLLEFYVHSDAPLACRLPARPSGHVSANDKELANKQEHIPLVFALAGKLEMSHMHISTHMNVLLHAVPQDPASKKYGDSGELDSAISYSTSPLAKGAGAAPTRLIIGSPLPFTFSVRWFPTPELPKTEGRIEWSGLGGHIYASTVFYSIVAFIAGASLAGGYCMSVVLPQRLKGRSLGGATPLGYGLHSPMGNGWGYAKRKD